MRMFKDANIEVKKFLQEDITIHKSHVGKRPSCNGQSGKLVFLTV